MSESMRAIEAAFEASHWQIVALMVARESARRAAKDAAQ